MKSRSLYFVAFFPLVISLFFLFIPLNSSSHNQLKEGHKNQNPSLTAEDNLNPQKLIFLLQYIGIDYGGAVKDGKIVNQFEYNEMVEFSRLVLKGYEKLLPEKKGLATHLTLQKLVQLVQNKVDGKEIQSLTSTLIRDLSEELNILPYPTKPIDLAEGRSLYQQTCAVCHGKTGDGKGPSARKLNPKPSNFREAQFSNKATPYQFFNAITFGVEGTGMASYKEVFTDQQRWNLAFYLTTLREDFQPLKSNPLPAITVQDLATKSNKTLVMELKNNKAYSDLDDQARQQLIDYLRKNPPQMSPEEYLQLARQKIAKSLQAYQKGNPSQAIKFSVEAYLNGIEPLEPFMVQKNASLVTETENEFGKYRRALKSKAPRTQVMESYHNLNRLLVAWNAEVASTDIDRGFTFIQSLTIIVREGIEAALLIALLITYLVASGYTSLKRYVIAGSLAGVVLGIITWIASEYFVQVSFLGQEALEGFTSLIAAAVLFSVSFWIIHKIDIQKWKTYIKSQAEKALGTGSGFALSFTAFLAVYREAFETVLFYQALWLKSEGAQSYIWLGFVLGTIALIILIVLIFKFGLRIPLKPFFGITGLLLGLLAFVFAGYGIRELQAIGLLKETPLPWNFNWKLLEIHSTIEGLAVQLGILLSFLSGWLTVYVEKFKNMKNVTPEPKPANEAA
ncbi:MAG: hypothetical protein D6813_06900 [Calditrichaeota bacterium]|nr:MAG: hypothetical protein D6813_06900 [Calditrichota bacterium]